MNYNTNSFELELPEEGLLFSPSSLYQQLLKFKDKRGRQGRQYELALIVSLAVIAKLADQDQVAAIAHWCKLRACLKMGQWDLQKR